MDVARQARELGLKGLVPETLSDTQVEALAQQAIVALLRKDLGAVLCQHRGKNPAVVARQEHEDYLRNAWRSS
jgi:acylphosphatase